MIKSPSSMMAAKGTPFAAAMLPVSSSFFVPRSRYSVRMELCSCCDGFSPVKPMSVSFSKILSGILESSIKSPVSCAPDSFALSMFF